MDIDFSPAKESINEIFFGLIKILGIPLAIALIVIFVLGKLKISKKIISNIAVYVFLILVYVQLMKL